LDLLEVVFELLADKIITVNRNLDTVIFEAFYSLKLFIPCSMRAKVLSFCFTPFLMSDKQFASLFIGYLLSYIINAIGSSASILFLQLNNIYVRVGRSITNNIDK